MQSIGRKTAIGMGWNMISSLGSISVQYALGIVLARLLSPQDFGKIVMIMVFVGFANVFKDFGFSKALIQKKELNSEHYSTAFWFNGLISVILYGILFISAPFISALYNDESMTMITRVLALSFLVHGLYLVPRAIFLRDLRIKQVALISIVSEGLSGICAILMAFNGYGIWALAAKPILLASFLSIGYFSKINWRPKLEFGKAELKDLWGFGSKLTLASIFTYWSKNIDNLILGAWIGPFALGNYSRGYKYMMMPNRLLVQQMASVLLPSFSRTQDNIAERNRIYFFYTSLLMMIMIPISLWFNSVSPELIPLLLGDKWRFAVPFIQIMSWASIFFSLGFPMILITSMGYSGAVLRITVLTGSLRILLILLGVYLFGAKGAAWAVVLSVAIESIFKNIDGLRLGGIKMKEYFDRLWPYLIYSLASIIPLVYFRVFPWGGGQFSGILVKSMTFLLIMFIAYWVIRPKSLSEVFQKGGMVIQEKGGVIKSIGGIFK